MGVPATSAPSERLFSAGGDITTKKRNRLGGKNTRDLLYLRSWGVIPEDDDEDEIEALPKVKGEESIEPSANRGKQTIVVE